MRIPEGDASRVREYLHGVPAAKVAFMQETIGRLYRRFVWTLRGKAVPGDAFHYLMHELYYKAQALSKTPIATASFLEHRNHGTV